MVLIDRKIIENAFSLISVQAALYVIPLITLPYLVKCLGVVNYGLYGFSLAVINYFILFVDYGFNISAAKKGAEIREDRYELGKVFYGVLYSRIIIYTICLLVIILLSFINIEMYDIKIILILSITVLCQVFFPVWYYQAVEELKKVALLNFISRLISVPLIFALVNSKEDIYILVSINALISTIPAIYCIYDIQVKKRVSFHKFIAKDVLYYLKDSWYVFISNVSVTLYTTTVTIMLGLLVGPAATGLFVAVDRIRKALQGLTGPISQVYFPRINSLMSNDRATAVGCIKLLYKIQIVVNLILCSIIFFFSEEIILLLYGSDFKEAVVLLKVVSYLPLIVSLSSVSGICVLISFGYKRIFSKIISSVAIFSLVFMPLLVYFFSELGASLAILISELIITTIMLYYVNKLELLRGN